MILIKRFAAILCMAGLALAWQSCSKENPGPTSKEVLLTVHIEPGYFPAGMGFEMWIFISDSHGNTIDVRRATDSTVIRLSGTNQGTFSVTKMFAIGDNSFDFSTYQGIAAGSTLYFNKGIDQSLIGYPPVGDAPFTLNNYTDSDIPAEAFIFSDSVDYGGILDINNTAYSGGIFSSPLHLRLNPTKLLISTYYNDEPVHLWVNDMKPGQAVTADFHSFVPSKTIPINKQVSSGVVYSMPATRVAVNYGFSDLISRRMSKSSNLSALPKLGYLDGFDKYYTQVALNALDSSSNLFYEKMGTIPKSINLPDYTFTIANSKLYDLKLNFSNVHTIKNASISFSKYHQLLVMNWNLNASGSEELKAPLIPNAIKTAYPMVSTDDMTLEAARYTQCLDGYTYANYVVDELAPKPNITHEWLKYYIRP